MADQTLSCGDEDEETSFDHHFLVIRDVAACHMYFLLGEEGRKGSIMDALGNGLGSPSVSFLSPISSSKISPSLLSLISSPPSL